MPAATNRNGLIQNVKRAWSAISPDTLDRLICGMPDRVGVSENERTAHW